MNTHHRVLASLIALCSISFAPSLPASTHNAGRMHPVDIVNIAGRNLTVGSSQAEVVQVLGAPTSTRLGDPEGKLNENVWVYRNMEGRAASGSSRESDCHTLLVTMVDNGNGTGWRISEMKLVDANAESFYTAQIKARTVNGLFAAR